MQESLVKTAKHRFRCDTLWFFLVVAGFCFLMLVFAIYYRILQAVAIPAVFLFIVVAQYFGFWIAFREEGMTLCKWFMRNDIMYSEIKSIKLMGFENQYGEGKILIVDLYSGFEHSINVTAMRNVSSLMELVEKAD